jgi:hypothetical protein
VARFFAGLVKKYSRNVAMAATIYVTPREARGLIVPGMDFALM